jgi:hypothetical protein
MSFEITKEKIHHKYYIHLYNFDLVLIIKFNQDLTPEIKKCTVYQ